MGALAQALLMVATSQGQIAPNAISGLKLWLDAQQAVYKAGNAAQFATASSRYLSHASNTDLQTGDIDFTFAAWVYLDTNAADQTFVGKDNSTAGQREYWFQFRNGTGFRGAVYTATDVEKLATAAMTVNTATWYFIVFWHDATANTINIQVNNGTVNSTATGGALQAASGAEFRVGARQFPANQNYVNGRMQDVGFWKRVLTAAEKTSIYNAGFGKDFSLLTTAEKVSMVSWWRLDEASGSRADSFGTNTLTDNNTVGQAAGNVASGTAAANGDSVGLWRDQSGLGFDAGPGVSPTYSVAPTGLNGKNAVSFSSQRLNSGASGSLKPFTVAMVIRPTAVGAVNRDMLGSSNVNGNFTLIGTGGNWQIGTNGSGAGSSTSALSANTSYLLLATYDGSGNYTYRTNGAADGSGTNNLTPTAATLVVGALTAAGASPYSGLIAEAILYDNVISSTDRAGLEAYLKAKYGL